MEIKPLSEVASIDISGVDKKTNDNEQVVKLCNFTDVYYNWAVSTDNHDTFMVATANKEEIKRFLLKKGSVAITKDSETREDIGISCYIADNLENTLLGYHCALIVPQKGILYGKYLNAYLHTKMARNYFSNQASGSGQRYTLTIGGIGAVKVPIIDYDDQVKIGKVFSNIDKKILNNNKINAELESMAKTLYDYWFLQFEFPNEEGKPYKSSGGKMVWNEELKREIPENWENSTLSKVSNMYQPKTFDAKLLDDNGIFRVYGAGGYMGQYNKFNHAQSEVFISCRGSCGNVYKSMPFSLITGNAMIVHSADERLFNYLYLTLLRIGVKNCITGSVQPQITRDSLNDWKLVVPNAELIVKFNQIISPLLKKQEEIINENQELTSLRDFLLPMLMNGQVTFKS